MNRLEHIQLFYGILASLEDRLGGCRRLAHCDRRVNWPQRGIYFFLEEGEMRSQSGAGPRVVRVGTHAVSSGSRSTLWKRLRQHKGRSGTGGGDHRASIFRGLVGAAISRREPQFGSETWEKRARAWGRKSTPKEIREQEHALECAVSRYIGQMPFLWLEVDDEPSRDSLRSYIERNAIALLSNWGKPGEEAIDAPSCGWLGHDCFYRQAKVRDAGLWNTRHVDVDYEPEFLAVLRDLVSSMRP